MNNFLNQATLDAIAQAYTYDLPKIQRVRDVRLKPKTFFRDNLFGGAPAASNDEMSTIEFRRGDTRVATDSMLFSDATIGPARDEHDIKIIRYAYFNNKEQVGPKDANKLFFGDDPLHPYTRQQRLGLALAEKRDKIIDAYAMAEEKMCFDALFTGTVESRNGGRQVFPLLNTMINFTVAKAWNTNTVKRKDVESDIVRAASLIYDNSGIVPTRLLVSFKDSMLPFYTSDATYVGTTIEAQRMLSNGQLQQETGTRHVGTIQTEFGPLEIITYLGKYVDASGNTHSLVPDGKAILCGPDPIGYMAYGPGLVVTSNGQDLQSVHNLATVYNTVKDGYMQDIGVVVQNAPMAVIDNLDSYVVIGGIDG